MTLSIENVLVPERINLKASWQTDPYIALSAHNPCRGFLKKVMMRLWYLCEYPWWCSWHTIFVLMISTTCNSFDVYDDIYYDDYDDNHDVWYVSSCCRRPAMVRNLKLRTKVLKTVKNFLDNQGFLDVETPNLTGSTPEGARDYLVPSRYLILVAS